MGLYSITNLTPIYNLQREPYVWVQTTTLDNMAGGRMREMRTSVSNRSSLEKNGPNTQVTE